MSHNERKPSKLTRKKAFDALIDQLINDPNDTDLMLLGSPVEVKQKKRNYSSSESKNIAEFKEVASFFKANNRLPDDQADNFAERKLAYRLNAYIKNIADYAYLKDVDTHNLLSGHTLDLSTKPMVTADHPDSNQPYGDSKALGVTESDDSVGIIGDIENLSDASVLASDNSHDVAHIQSALDSIDDSELTVLASADNHGMTSPLPVDELTEPESLPVDEHLEPDFLAQEFYDGPNHTLGLYDNDEPGLFEQLDNQPSLSSPVDGLSDDDQSTASPFNDVQDLGLTAHEPVALDQTPLEADDHADYSDGEDADRVIGFGRDNSPIKKAPDDAFELKEKPFGTSSVSFDDADKPSTNAKHDELIATLATIEQSQSASSKPHPKAQAKSRGLFSKLKTMVNQTKDNLFQSLGMSKDKHDADYDFDDAPSDNNGLNSNQTPPQDAFDDERHQSSILNDKPVSRENTRPNDFWDVAADSQPQTTAIDEGDLGAEDLDAADSDDSHLSDSAAITHDASIDTSDGDDATTIDIPMPTVSVNDVDIDKSQALLEQVQKNRALREATKALFTHKDEEDSLSGELTDEAQEPTRTVLGSPESKPDDNLFSPFDDDADIELSIKPAISTPKNNANGDNKKTKGESGQKKRITADEGRAKPKGATYNDDFELVSQAGAIPVLTNETVSSIDDILALNSDFLDELCKKDNHLFDMTGKYDKRPDRAVSDKIGRQTQCHDFYKFERKLLTIGKQLKTGELKSIRYTESNLRQGDAFIVGGMIGIIQEIGEYREDNEGRYDPRLRLIFDNGTESDILLRTFSKKLYTDRTGRRVIPSADDFTDFDTKDDSNGASHKTGELYILKSKSTDPKLKGIKNLCKIGFTKHTVADRIKHAQNDSTFLEAPVEVLATVDCFNLDPKGLEGIIHAFLHYQRINVTLTDKQGRSYKPKEWFDVDFEDAKTIIASIVDGSITKYRMDNTTNRLIQK